MGGVEGCREGVGGCREGVRWEGKGGEQGRRRSFGAPDWFPGGSSHYHHVTFQEGSHLQVGGSAWRNLV